MKVTAVAFVPELVALAETSAQTAGRALDALDQFLTAYRAGTPISDGDLNIIAEALPKARASNAELCARLATLKARVRTRQ